MAVVLSRKPGGSGGGGAPSGPAGGVLAGTYPNPTFATDVPGTELAYVEVTNDVTVNGSEGSPNDVVSSGAIVYAAVRIKIECFVPEIDSASGTSFVVLSLWDASTDLGRFLVTGQSTGTGNDQVNPVYGVRYLTPSAGSHTYRVRAWKTGNNGTVNVGTGGAGNNLPGFIRVSIA